MKYILLQAMQYCKNHFVHTSYKSNISFANNLIKGVNIGIAKQGQYILIATPYLNDEIYKIESVSAKGIQVSEQLQTEQLNNATIYHLQIPPNFIRLCTVAKDWQDKQNEKGSSGNISSERFGDYSVSYNNTNSGYNFLDEYKSQFAGYRRLLNDVKC